MRKYRWHYPPCNKNLRKENQTCPKETVMKSKKEKLPTTFKCLISFPYSLQRSDGSNLPDIWLLSSSFLCVWATQSLILSIYIPFLFKLGQGGYLLVLRYIFFIMKHTQFLMNTCKFPFYIVYIYLPEINAIFHLFRFHYMKQIGRASCRERV